jgi:hypothetical protein
MFREVISTASSTGLGSSNRAKMVPFVEVLTPQDYGCRRPREIAVNKVRGSWQIRRSQSRKGLAQLDRILPAEGPWIRSCSRAYDGDLAT